MVEIEFRRHSVKDGVNRHLIGPQGMALARLVGRQQLSGRAFTHFTASHLMRTTQTLVGMAEGAGDFAFTIERPLVTPHEDRGHQDDAMELWTGPCRRAELAGGDMVQAAIDEAEEIVRTIADETSLTIATWMRGLPYGSRILAIGHSPSLEFLALGFSDRLLPQLGFCDGFRVRLDGGIFKITTIEDDPSLCGSALLQHLHDPSSA